MEKELDLYQNSRFEEPIQTDCSTDTVPYGATNAKNDFPHQPRKLMLPELTSMFKYLFSSKLGNKRLEMYTFLNRQLRAGRLSRIVGFKVLNSVINREVCEFTGVKFRKVTRSDFYADVEVTLKLNSYDGVHIWKGFLTCFCCFGEKFFCEIDELTDYIDRKSEGYELLSTFLVPYYTSRRMDEIAEEMWVIHGMRDALTEPKKRDAKELARRMGLKILYLPVYEHRNVESILFFEDSDLIVGCDKVEKMEDGTQKILKTKIPQLIHIEANTIVININLVQERYSSFCIFHECIHYELHYAFFKLQNMATNDVRNIAVKEVEIQDDECYSDPVYFMEKQANRGAYGLLLPADHTLELILRECLKIKEYRHKGELYEFAGLALAKQLNQPHFRIRARMIQLGLIQAKGSLTYVNKKLIRPFAFDIDSWREEEITYVIDPQRLGKLCEKTPELKSLLDSGKYVYADGHVVRNDPGFVTNYGHSYYLTDLANAHVDDCCLRFVRQYIQRNVGSYILGRMFFDSEYLEQTMFYLDDYINKKNLDELDAKDQFIIDFPKDFKEAVDFLKKRNRVSNEKLAEYFHMDDSTFARILNEPRRYRNEDFLTALCLFFKLPDWLSKLIFKRAHYLLDEDIKRHRALLHIFRVQSCDGIEAADMFLKQHNLPPIDLSYL